MAHTDHIEERSLNYIVSQITELINAGADKRFLNKESLALTETFAVWTIDPSVLDSSRKDIADVLSSDIARWATSTRQWHHQIRFGAKAKAFARSAYRGEGSTELYLAQLTVAPQAGMIDRAINLVDREGERDSVLRSDPVVRLLELPAYSFTSLWLLDESARESRALIIDAPSRYKNLEHDKFLTSQVVFSCLITQGPLLRII